MSDKYGRTSAKVAARPRDRRRASAESAAAVTGFKTCVEQLLSRNMERFRGGLELMAHRLLCHSTLGSRVTEKKKKNLRWRLAFSVWGLGLRIWGFKFRVSGFGIRGLGARIWRFRS